MGKRFIKRQTALVRRIDVLHDRQPFQQHGPEVHTPLQFRERIVAIRIDRCPEQHLRMFGSQLHHVIVGYIKMRSLPVKAPVRIVDGVKGQDHGRVELFGAGNGCRQLGRHVALRCRAVLPGQSQPPAHEAKEQTVAHARRQKTMFRRIGRDVHVAVDDHGGMVGNHAAAAKGNGSEPLVRPGEVV